MYKPMKKQVTTSVDVSYLFLEAGHFITVVSNKYSVEIVCKENGTFQVCTDDETFESGIHQYEDIYGPDPFKEEA